MSDREFATWCAAMTCHVCAGSGSDPHWPDDDDLRPCGGCAGTGFGGGMAVATEAIRLARTLTRTEAPE